MLVTSRGATLPEIWDRLAMQSGKRENTSCLDVVTAALLVNPRTQVFVVEPFLVQPLGESGESIA
jgi:hypothetical protein